ncbi:MAG: glycosyltransferase family 4 protein [Bacilli bacterium]|nr:glycosyltransferase family 4 protein [Bacilli bacterium]
MKKISILSLHLNYGGIERAVVSLANYLCKYYDVEIACTYRINKESSFKLDKRIKVKYLTTVVPNKKEFKSALKSFKLITAFKEGIKSIKILKLRKNSMIEYISNTDSDVIISTRDLFNNLLSKYKKDQLTIGWEHNHHHGNMRYAKKIVNSVKNLDYFVLVSNNLKEFYSNELKDTKCKCVYIPNTLDSISKTVSNLKEKRMISVGRLSKEKGYMDLLSISKDIFKDNKDWTLDIIGDGSERDSLQKYIRENNLSKNVKLHGFKDKDFINNLLSKSSIYLMTSYTESFGIVLIEAMNYGLPVIAFSDAEGAREIIKNNKNGYLIDDRDKSKYIDKVNELINDYDLRVKLGTEGKKDSKDYDPEIVYKKWIDLIK